MIQLNPDYLFFETAPGKIIPCAADMIAVELIGEEAEKLDPEIVQHAAAAVLHYFRQDLGWTTVSVGEFSKALEQALRVLGVRLSGNDAAGPTRGYDLRQLATATERAFELTFFPKLREVLQMRLGESPKELRFYGLRGCVKQLVGAKRWSGRCQRVNDQIVSYLRACLEMESSVSSCELVIR